MSVTPSVRSSAEERVWPRGTLMARLSGRAGKDLLARARPRAISAGTVLMSQGEKRDHVLLLRSRDAETDACVKISATSRSGHESLLGIRVSGDVVGELAALRGTPRTATVTTCAATLVHSIPRDSFIAFLNEHTEAWEAMCRMIADRLDWANRRRLEFTGYDIPDRLARVLLELTEQYGRATAKGYDLGVRLSHAELGKLIGASEDAIGLGLRRLRARRLVTSAYRSVTINDLDRLREFADAM
ncbi:Crp/Fnr family transcriptional regulator [Nocardia paucivorans]|uniref:Crp/Fnr family transcriptional regulator n=1 Tax=Nocardia paucivorans TaxID=114259 RepID=UPI000593C321|nr:Crp/Fnr family transcriptional regulator [Nocardia paucivorans]